MNDDQIFNLGVLFCCLFLLYTVCNFAILYLKGRAMNEMAERIAKERESL